MLKTSPRSSPPRRRPRAHTGKRGLSCPLPFPAGEARKLPEHWRTFEQRASLISGGPRMATNPANAILNYLYALLEAEAIFACHALGLDPGMAIFHQDREGRASLALDLMEAARPAVDAYVARAADPADALAARVRRDPRRRLPDHTAARRATRRHLRTVELSYRARGRVDREHARQARTIPSADTSAAHARASSRGTRRAIARSQAPQGAGQIGASADVPRVRQDADGRTQTLLRELPARAMDRAGIT